jgi:hypothetical protein
MATPRQISGLTASLTLSLAQGQVFSACQGDDFDLNFVGDVTLGDITNWPLLYVQYGYNGGVLVTEVTRAAILTSPGSLRNFKVSLLYADTVGLYPGVRSWEIRRIVFGTQYVVASGTFNLVAARPVPTVTSQPTITSANTVNFTLGVSNTFTVTTGGFPVGTISVTGSLPSGVTFTDNGNGTATIAGTPPFGSSFQYPLTLTANNGLGIATQSFTLQTMGLITSGLVVQYQFDEGSGITITDHSGNGYNGTIPVTTLGVQAFNWSNSPTWSAAGLVFDGTQAFSVPVNAIPSGTKTVQVFLTPNMAAPNVKGHGALFGFSGSVSAGTYFGLSALDGKPIVGSDFANYFFGGTSPWYSGAGSVTYTYTPPNQQFAAGDTYINGVHQTVWWQNQINTVTDGPQGPAAPGVAPYSFFGCWYGGFNGFAGTAHWAMTWNRKLTLDELRQNDLYVRTVSLASRGLSFVPVQIPSGTLLAYDGDSIQRGFVSGGPYNSPNQGGGSSVQGVYLKVKEQLTKTYSHFNISEGGQTLTNMLNLAPTELDPVLTGFTGNSVLIVNGGTNEGWSDYSNLLLYCQQRKAAGWKKIVIITGLPRNTDTGGTQAARAAWNTSIRTQANPPWDAIADWGNDPNMGQNGQGSSSTYYSDGTHPTDVGYQVGTNYVLAALATLGVT